MEIREAIKGDLGRITEIYNEAVVNSVATMDMNPRSEEEAVRWFDEHNGGYKIFVAVENNFVAGWGSLSRWSDREGYKFTVENSVFVDKDYRGKGIGKKLLEELIRSAEKSGYHVIIARIATSNEISIKLHKVLGFEDVGVQKEVGFKFGEWVDITILQKRNHDSLD